MQSKVKKGCGQRKSKRDAVGRRKHAALVVEMKRQADRERK